MAVRVPPRPAPLGLSLGVLSAVVIAAVITGLSAAADSVTTYGVATSAILVGLVALMYWSRLAPSEPRFAQVVMLALAFRCVMSMAHLAILVFYYRGGDALYYNEMTLLIGERFLSGDFTAMETFGGATGYVFSYVLGVMYLLVGGSAIGQCLVSAMLAFAGGYLFLRAFEHEFPGAPSRRFVALSLFFLPSFAYWTSMLGKESWMTLSLGAVTWGFAKFVHRARLRYVAVIASGLLGTLIVRPAIGAIVLLALGAALILRRPRGSAAMLWPVIIIVLMVAGAMVTSRAATFALAQKVAAEEVSKGVVNALFLQHVGLATDPTSRGSSLGVQITDPSIGGILRYLPVGIFTFLFRPMIFEAHNAVAAIAALETTFLLGLVVWRIRGLLRALRWMFASPLVMFCLTMFGVVTVVLSFESNFGAIVRHRAMPLPFLLMLLGLPAFTRRREPEPSTEAPA